MTTPTPEQLREAASHLAKAVETMCGTSWEWVEEALDALPPRSIERHSIAILAHDARWDFYDPNYAAWLCEAARRRLLLEALWQEKPTLDETRAESWHEVAAWKAAWATLVEELLGGVNVGTTGTPETDNAARR